MKKTCRYCGRIHERNYQCPSKPARKKKVTSVDKFRWTAVWQKKRNQIKRRDKHMCQVCLQSDRYVSTDIEVHHIDSLVDAFDKRLDDENLITLCRHHHEEAELGNISKQSLFDIAEQNNENYEL